MAQYVYDISKLNPGDILLERYDDKLSKFIMDKSNSDFSHAILYDGNGSNLESTLDIVVANNISRTIIDDSQSVSVYRLKDCYYDPIVIEKAISYARLVYGTSYSQKDARAIITGIKDKDINRQTCTRMVAQAYAVAGIKLVQDPDFCSTKEIEESPFLVRVDNVVRIANSLDIEFADSEDVTVEMTIATIKLLRTIRKITGYDIQTLNQVLFYLLEHPETDKEISQAAIESGYFNVWKSEKDKNPWSYDTDLYFKKYKKMSLPAAMSHFKDLQSTWFRFQNEYQKFLKMTDDQKKLTYIQLQTSLYKDLLNNTCIKMMVVIQILQSYGVE